MLSVCVSTDIATFNCSRTVGQTLTYSYIYSKSSPINIFFCKGEDPSICEPLATSQRSKNINSRFSLVYDKVKWNITIRVRDLTTADTGTYWCGAKRTDLIRSNPFFYRITMVVGEFWHLMSPYCTGLLSLQANGTPNKTFFRYQK